MYQFIQKYFGKSKAEHITYDDFKSYYQSLLTAHSRCGEYCIHLHRFFARFGFTTKKFQKRIQLQPKKQQLTPFNEVTKSSSKPDLRQSATLQKSSSKMNVVNAINADRVKQFIIKKQRSELNSNQ